jgi:hypothetical protein
MNQNKPLIRRAWTCPWVERAIVQETDGQIFLLSATKPHMPTRVRSRNGQTQFDVSKAVSEHAKPKSDFAKYPYPDLYNKIIGFQDKRLAEELFIKSIDHHARPTNRRKAARDLEKLLAKDGMHGHLQEIVKSDRFARKLLYHLVTATDGPRKGTAGQVFLKAILEWSYSR